MLNFPPRSTGFGDAFYRMFGGNAKNVTFIVTKDCSQRCSYCFEHHKANEAMTLDVAKKAIDMLFSEDASGSAYVNEQEANGLILDFIGGEPLLEIDLIDAAMDYFLHQALEKNHRWANKFMISMSSNGTHYFEQNVQAFMNKWNGRVSIGITIDGNEELHDSCRRTTSGGPTYFMAARAFKDAKQRFGQTGTKMTLSQSNLKYLYAACVDMIEKFDLKELQGNPIFEDEWTVEDASLYYNELKRLADWLIETGRWETTWLAFFNDFIGKPLPAEENRNFCGSTGKMLAIDVDGKIYPCLRFAPISIGDDIAKSCVIGNVGTGLASNEQENEFLCSLCAITRRSQSNDQCWTCPIASGCATCSAWQYELYGTADKRCTNICHMHKARVMAASYFYNTLYKKYDQPERFVLNIPREWAIQIIGEKEHEMLISLASTVNM